MTHETGAIGKPPTTRTWHRPVVAAARPHAGAPQTSVLSPDLQSAYEACVCLNIPKLQVDPSRPPDGESPSVHSLVIWDRQSDRDQGPFLYSDNPRTQMFPGLARALRQISPKTSPAPHGNG